jgi:hypothetical protein
MLKNLREFVKAYMNDIMIFFKTLNDHFTHLRAVFERLWHYNVALNLKKVFLDYSSIVLFEQMINALNLITAKEKLATIANFAFSIILKKLKTYLELTSYMRMYVSWYAQTSLLLQNRKILLLKNDLVKEKLRKTFVKKEILKKLIELEIRSYEHLQIVFNKESFLRHFDQFRKLFINVNISKKKDVEVMIFHVKDNSEKDITFRRADIESIMFLSKIFIFAETRYWFTELKMIDVIWVVKKVRHMIECSKISFTIIFTNHAALIEIIKQTSFTFFNTNKLNLRLMKISQYFSVLFIEIRVKFEKFHMISNALSRLFSITNKNDSTRLSKEDVLENLKYDLNVMLIQFINECKTSSFDTKFVRMHEYLDVYFDQNEFLMKITKDYRKNLLETYNTNTQWIKLKEKLNNRKNSKNISDDINFIVRNELVYYVSKEKTFKLCISWTLKKDIYKMIHDDNHHCEFHKVYARISESIYIRHMIKRLRRYIHHCKFCLENQIKRHSSYDELNSIRIMTFSFHTVIIDFVMILSQISSDENVLLIIIDKFIKRVSLIFDKNSWDVSQWASIWLNALQREEWRLSKIIIFDRDSKFVNSFWKATFHYLNVALHFIIAYHLSSDDQSKRTNQIIKIVIKYVLMNKINFIKVISFIQFILNNSTNAFIEVIFNELFYEFKIAKSLNLLERLDDENLTTSIEHERNVLKKQTKKTIVFVNANMKIRYDSTRTSLDLNVEDSIFLKFHKDYNQSDLTNWKFSKQRLESIKMLEKIEKLIYRLDILNNWKIHSIIFVIHLESISKNDFYERKTKESESIEDTQRNIKDIYEIENILAKRFIKIERSRKSKIQYKIKWKEWKDHHNQWINATDMKNVKNAMNEFEQNLITQDDNEQWFHSFIKTSSTAISHLQVKFIVQVSSISTNQQLSNSKATINHCVTSWNRSSFYWYHLISILFDDHHVFRIAKNQR